MLKVFSLKNQKKDAAATGGSGESNTAANDTKIQSQKKQSAAQIRITKGK